MAGDEMQKFAVKTENIREQASGKRDRVSYDRLEHGLCVGRRGADRAKNFRGCCLLLQRLGQFALHPADQLDDEDQRDHAEQGEKNELTGGLAGKLLPT